jgi:hypothetical protein
VLPINIQLSKIADYLSAAKTQHVNSSRADFWILKTLLAISHWPLAIDRACSAKSLRLMAVRIRERFGGPG